MQMNISNQLNTLAALLLMFPISLLSQPASEARPNVILVMTDDQGYGDIGALGNTMIRTPNLDRLHSQSARFTNFHVDPTCSPTRSALMTGRYSTRTGTWHTIMGRSLMYHDEVTIAQVFAKSGYRTGIFGKWHLGDNYPMRPQDRGFQEVLVNGGGGITQTPDFWGNTYFDDTLYHNGKPEKYSGYCTDVFFENALKFIEKDRSKPFFVYLPTNAAHGPFNVADRYSRPYREKGVPSTMANFYGMIENIDENMGRLTSRLREWNLEANTILIFMTDNGTAAGATGANRRSANSNVASWEGFNAGMRGQKGSEYDGGHRVPFFIRWPSGGIGGGRDISNIAAHIDLFPTLIDLCRLDKPYAVRFDGRSLVPLLLGQSGEWPDRTLFAHVQRQEIPPKWTRSAIMTDRWRLNNRVELYDMDSDPAQAKNVAEDHPEILNRLHAAYEKWWESLTPSFSRFGYIVIGSEHENPAHITCHDWHSDQVPWSQNAIKNAPLANGYWMIQVDHAGAYEFTLRQQPAVAEFPIQANQARIQIGDEETTGTISTGADSVTLTLNLKAGSTKMQTWLTDAATGKSRGAFFVDARRLD